MILIFDSFGKRLFEKMNDMRAARTRDLLYKSRLHRLCYRLSVHG